MMTGAFANLLLNTLIAALLAVTIAYCWLLNRRIKILQDSRGELALLLKHFDDSTIRASDSIIALQTASKKIGDNIQTKIEKSNYLLDDLAFMIDKGEKIANKLEASFAVSRARNRVIAEQPPEIAAKPVKSAKVEIPEKKQAQDKIEMTEQESKRPAAFTQYSEKTLNQRDKTTASLEAVLERMVGRNKDMDSDVPPPPVSSSRSSPLRPRSKVEQELLDMIKTGIKG